MFLIRFSINNPLLTNMLLVIVLIMGVLSWQVMPQEMFPAVELDKVRISTVFEGATPEEVDRQVTLPIEEEFDGVADIDVITSVSQESVSTVMIELKPGTNIDEFLNDARDRISRITDLPDLIEDPEVVRLETRFPVISVALYGEIARGELYTQAEQVKRKLLQIPGVASVGVAGDREWELWAIVDPEQLAARKVPLGSVISALRDNLNDIPGGSIKSVEGDILLRGKGTTPDVEGLAGIPLRTNDRGGQLLLGEVARVELRLEEAQTLGRFNGKPSVNLTITKTVEASTIEVANRVRVLAAQLEDELPGSLHIGLFSDLSVYVKTRLNTVKSSGLVGLVLVLLSLYLFLNFRVAFITAMGIPVSFLFAIIMINYFGYTINMISLFAFLIALGMIVDDAIIVTENVYRHMEEGMPRYKAAQTGASEVFWPVIASTTTTIAAFLPMFSIGGTLGTFIAVIPAVVIFALLGSLLEAFGVLPSHAAEVLRVEKSNHSRFVDWSAWLQRYLKVLRRAVHSRYLVSLATVGVLLILVVFAQTRLPFQLFGNVDIGQFFVNIEAPSTFSIDDSRRLAAKAESAIEEVVADNELKTMLTNVGITIIDFNRFRFGSHYIQLVIDLKKQEPQGFIERWVTPVVNLRFEREGTRQRDANEIIDAVRERIARINGVQRLSILRPQGGPAGADIEVGVRGHDIAVLQEEAIAIRDYLRSLSGVHDARQDMESGKLEYRYTLNERGRQLGLTQRDLANAVRSGFLGLEVTYVTWRDKRIPVRVIYPEDWRETSSQLKRLRITLPGGEAIYLGEVADIDIGRGLNAVSRRGGQRLATVTAEVNSEIITPLEAAEQIRQQFADLPERRPGYDLVFLGEKKEAADSIADMIRATFVALAIIYFILIALFRSLLDPLVVMFAIPFGISGVIIGHAVFGYHLQFLSLVGFLALSGIVVNDSLILVDFIKRLRAQGWDRIEAVIEAGRVRIRPILLTTITTFLGISPLIFFATGQTAFLSPMAVSLGVGLLFATVLILVVLPCFYLIADDLRHYTCRGLRRLLGQPEPDENIAPICLVSEHPAEND
ncbi:efflux RND transporter permease subunit [Sulfuriflexus sp.]|uniref:efflux RND transporter permease subunit n=1 Tax=Sulfuriflexus sp. TaxID=2015443 RepID=UPI0028CED623|nr:efflux RND transporter permease subunit [Sulfuriflexus sp.]MDT8403342.1 efflux RND transporter permease subunit [Sulfuriflexus sp.]